MHILLLLFLSIVSGIILGGIFTLFKLLPVWEHDLKTEKDMYNWFDYINKLLINKGEKNGEFNNKCLSN